MATCSLLWLPAVYYDYTYSLPSVQPRILYTAILYYVNLVFIIPTSVLLSLYLPMQLFVLKFNCIPCLVYTSMTMPIYGCYVSLVFDVAILIVSYRYLVRWAKHTIQLCAMCILTLPTIIITAYSLSCYLACLLLVMLLRLFVGCHDY